MTRKSYVARKACGCIVAAVVADGSRDAADELWRWAKAGYVIDTVDDEVVRREFVGEPCPHTPHQTRLFDDVESDAS